MKKFSLKAVVAATAALAAGSVLASVDFTVTPTATTGVFASELNYSGTGAGTANISAEKSIKTPLGFGVSGAQDRYIRIDLTGAKFAVAVASPANVPTTSAAPAFSNSVLVAGGAVGDTYAIFQITANAAGHASTQAVDIALPDLQVTNGNTASPSVQYRLYETAVSAVNAGDALSSRSGALFTFGKGLEFTLTKGTNQAIVAESYKKFTGSTNGPVKLGSFKYGAKAGVLKANGGAVTLADLVTAASKIVFAGNFGASRATGAVLDGLTANTAADACGGAALTLNSTATSADLTVGATAVAAGALCYEVNGTTAIAEQTEAKVNAITAALDITAAAGTTTSDVAAATIGEITRDGTNLQSPWFSVATGYTSRIVLTSTHTADAIVTAQIITADGATCAGGTFTSATLKAGKQLAIETSELCASVTGGAPRAAAVLTIAAPTTTIQGMYQIVAPNGAVSVSPLLRPGTN